MLKTYIVTLRNHCRTQIYRTVTACVSPQAACQVAELLQQQGDTAKFHAVFAHPLQLAKHDR